MPKRRSPPQPALTTTGGQLVLGARLAAFKRLYRWLNLTLVHQATWPLLVLLTTAVANEPEQTPMPWYLARLGAPLVAALVAFAYLRRQLVGPRQELLLPAQQIAAQDPLPPHSLSPQTRGKGGAAPPLLQHQTASDSPLPDLGEGPGERANTAVPTTLTQQARFLLIGLPIMVAVVRLAQGPIEPATKLMLFGLADVAAYHLIHFGVVARSYPDRSNGLTIATALFALSWGIHDALLTAIGSSEASAWLAFLGGLVIGAVVGVLMRGLQRWPGGWIPAVATHWLLIYIIFGFAG